MDLAGARRGPDATHPDDYQAGRETPLAAA
jgi:hypothetical protein